MATYSTRADAKANGASRYNTGKPCVNGHLSDRYIGGVCVACQAERAEAEKVNGIRAQRREANREAIREQHRKYWAANSAEIAARRKAAYSSVAESARIRAKNWYEANRTRALAAASAWAQKNQATVKAAKHKYKSKRRVVSAVVFSDLDHFAVEEACDLVVRRERSLGGKWHVDHMVPLFARNACGLHVAANLAVIPASVNVRKQNKFILTTPGAWLREV